MATQKKASCWSITINNPTEDDFRNWEALKGQSWVKEVRGQIEKGEENGTPHIQGMVKTDHIRFSQVKKALPRAHIEPAKNVAALTAYVQKEETRVAAIPTTKVATQVDVQRKLLDLTLEGYLKTGQENCRDKFYGWICLQEVTDKHFVEAYIDASVKQLILEGYYGVEFVMSNPQVRSAFKRYFSAIIIRQYGAQGNSSQGTSRVEGQEEDDAETLV